jgi:2-desacetyl-2-hydroxyethyl bacteriochlorophyllide A dehydrogenase
MMNLDTISDTRLGKLAARLPADRTWVRLLKASAKAALLRRRVVRGWRVVFGGLEDAILERFYAPGPGPGEVSVDSLVTAISPGTERAYYRNLPNFQQGFPFFPGYSGCGIVTAAGRMVRGLRTGDRVAGVLKHASRTIVAAEEVVRLMDRMDAMDSMDAAFVTIGVIALIGVKAAGIKPGETIVVMGQGIIGQIANQIAKALGSGKVIAAARTEDKKQLSLQHGADSFIALASGTGPDDIADKVIDASGSSAAFETALRMTRPGGTTVLLGSSADHGIESAWPRIVSEKRLTVKGAHIRNLAAEGSSYRERASEFLGLVAGDRVRVSSLITHRFKPEEAAKVYRQLADGDPGLVGAIFEWKKRPK